MRLRDFGWREVMIVGVTAVLVVMAALLVRRLRLSSCQQQLIREGFPQDYAWQLAPLRLDHPTWQFVPLGISDLNWQAILDRECTPSWNLVSYSKWAPEPWTEYGTANYTPYFAKNAKAYDSGAWYQASRAAVAYFMDPRNFLNELDVFMFESLEFNASAHTPEAVERALAGSFMANAVCNGGSRKFSEALMEVGRELGVSPVFLAARLRIEQGTGTVQGLGRIGDSLVELYTNGVDKVGNSTVWGTAYTKDGTRTKEVVRKGAKTYNGYYNLFNIGACGSGLFEIRYNAWREAASDEVCRRYCGPWVSQERSLRGGAIKIKERYLDTHRYTRYFQKFSVVPAAGAFRWKQYMQNIAAPLKESRNTSAAYAAAGALEAPYRFVIPIYTAMPSRPSPDPAKGRSTLSPSRSGWRLWR